jgi:hypothetical protein
MIDDEECEAVDGIKIGKVDQSAPIKLDPVYFCSP